MRYRSVSDGAIDDCKRAFTMAAGGALLFAPVEYVGSLLGYEGPLSLGAKLRFVALVATLSLIAWLAIAIATAVVTVAARALRAALGGRAGACGRGWFDAAPLAGGIRPGVPIVWAVVATGGLLGLALQRFAVWAGAEYKEPQLTAGVIAAVGLVACATAPRIARAIAIGTRGAAVALAPILRFANPLGRWRATGVVFAALVLGGSYLAGVILPQSRSELPSLQLRVDAVAIALGMGLGAWLHAWRRPRRLKRPVVAGLALGAWALVTVTLVWWGADPETRYIVASKSGLDRVIDLVRFANDVDRDGYGSLLGENDCAPFDSTIHPSAIDTPDDGIDQNCDGNDFSLKEIAMPTGSKLPVPAAFQKDWNFLLITIDTVRYDHTTFGGYAKSPKARNTTPNLQKLVDKSTSFTFVNAPSAGTMASIPAIITSKYFHSGIALDEKVPPGSPPILMPENVTLPEIMKRNHYYTGVIASHEYWNNWGMDQGVDEYDNSIGKVPDPFRIAADKVTDRILGFVSRQQGKKWFLWAHYIDPHGRYVAHPDVVDYGREEPNLYDAEIQWTDQEIGRLLRELDKLPSAANTIIVITSDHGDSMAEHNVPLGTHGTALYRELLHVPMIIYVPDNKPRLINGAVSNLDIVPTIAELAGIDVHDLQFEGRTEVPALFYGKEDRERIVFSETNAPNRQRAAISEKYKLISYLTTNQFELFDLTKDPWEHDNLATRMAQTDEPYKHMKAALDSWLQRVVYMADPKFNQAYRAVADLTLPGPPTPQVVTEGVTLDGGRIEVLGIGIEAGKSIEPKQKVDLHVYLHALQQPVGALRFELAAWPLADGGKPTDPLPPSVVRSTLRATAEGVYPTTRWGAGQYIRERFHLAIPADWKGDRVAVGLVIHDGKGYVKATTPAPSNEPNTAILGVLPLGTVGSNPKPGP